AAPELFAAAAKALNKAGARVVAIQGPGEAESVNQLKALAGLELPVAVLDLDGLKAFFSMTRLLVSNDGGTMHLAAAMGASALALFSATDPKIWASEGVVPVDMRGRERRAAESEVTDLALKLLEPPAPALS
ncbi:MAG: hypothetical protein KGI84_02990, partial [Elusimicrobia bacterium]|nr:hypothetical protein [Elusimicrobiota bacterium]